MSSEVLVVDNIGKCYLDFSNELHRFARWVGIPMQPKSEHWVLRHASFRINAGEAVGIIGQNGAGKSTLLKMVVGTVRPSEGSVQARGRVSALLELGLGFNPELSGAENVRHAAGLMGVQASEIERLMPQIEAFAEIGEYFDQPVRTYSSGMQMRIAFSVATAVRPDILIVDEALAVGDSYFVHKCFQRIREFREAGTTLLIVSHDPTAIQALCDRAILLDAGRVILDGRPQQVFDYYNALISEKENANIRTEQREAFVATESGSGEVFFESLQLLDASGNEVEYIGVGDPVTLRALVRVRQKVPSMVFGYTLRDRLGQPVYGTNTHYTEQIVTDAQTGELYEFKARFDAALGPGSYSVSVALCSTETHLVDNFQWKDLALVFTVANLNRHGFVGVAHLPPIIEIRRAPEAAG